MQRLEAKKESWFGWGEDVRDDVVRQGGGKKASEREKNGGRVLGVCSRITHTHTVHASWGYLGTCFEYLNYPPRDPVIHVPMARLATLFAPLGLTNHFHTVRGHQPFPDADSMIFSQQW